MRNPTAPSTRESCLWALTAASAPRFRTGTLVRDSVDAVEGRLSVDPGLLAHPGDAVFLDLQVDVLAHVVAVAQLPDPQTDLALAAQRPLLAANGLRDGLQCALRRGEEFVALPPPLLGQQRIAARAESISPGSSEAVTSAESCGSNHESWIASLLTSFRIAGALNAVMQHDHSGGASSSRMRAVVIGARFAHNGEVLQAAASPQLPQLWRQRHGIAGVALYHLHAEWAPPRVTHWAEDHLQLAKACQPLPSRMLPTGTCATRNGPT